MGDLQGRAAYLISINISAQIMRGHDFELTLFQTFIDYHPVHGETSGLHRQSIISQAPASCSIKGSM